MEGGAASREGRYVPASPFPSPGAELFIIQASKYFVKQRDKKMWAVFDNLVFGRTAEKKMHHLCSTGEHAMVLRSEPKHSE